VGLEVLAALSELPTPPRVHSFAAGLGGRDIPLSLLEKLLAAAERPHPERFSIIDVELERLPEADR
jgi:pyruvate ferredoxin oxidoreductase alpha subunit